MATSKFLRTFRSVAGAPITTATIWLVPQANTYPTGALALTAHGTRDGQYYRDNVPDGEYKIYIDPAGGSSPTLYEEEIWIGEARITTISDHFDAADSYKLKGSGIKLDNSTIETSSEILRVKDLGVAESKLAAGSVSFAKMKKVLLADQVLTDMSQTTITHNITSYAFASAPFVLITNKSEWGVYLISVSTTDLVLGVNSFGAGTVQYDLLLIHQ